VPRDAEPGGQCRPARRLRRLRPANGAAEAAAIIIELAEGAHERLEQARKTDRRLSRRPHRDARFYRIAEIYERAWAEDGATTRST
jgi:hypothetical protein